MLTDNGIFCCSGYVIPNRNDGDLKSPYALPLIALKPHKYIPQFDYKIVTARLSGRFEGWKPWQS
ncbi:hypothetical protein GCM10011339_08800 [Echinicola rosea]|uniref:Uncharacterized protein n=1 Tax=Echinicola rosea TaxID=1807691 RepID=A0ABQ1UQZ7_9BACT|nr:hypothetical protein GCM10011339_08800 [Echinicola rosea]